MPAPWVATQYAAESEPEASPRSMHLDRVAGIFGAARHETAPPSHDRRQGKLVEAD